MEKFLKLIKNQSIVFIVIIIVSLYLRFYNFSSRIIYGPEQARSLLTASLNIIDKPSLLGQEYFRYTSQGHKLFYSATFTYALIPFLFLFNNNILLITSIFTLLNVVTGLVVFYVAKRIFNIYIALFSLTLFLLNSYMIYHSLFLWPYNLLPLFGVLSVYLIYLIKLKEKISDCFYLGLVSGLGFGVQYLYAPYIVIIFISLLLVSTKKIKNSLVFIAGIIIGDLPMVIFDFKHNFYNLNTSIRFLFDTFLGKSDASFNYYYLLPLWGIGALALGFVLYMIYKRSKFLAIGLVGIYILVNVNSKLVNLNKSLGMPEGLIWSDYIQVAKTIANDKPKDFNVVTLLDFDTRAYVLRFPLEAIYRIKPMDVEEYPKASTLYVFGRVDYNINNPSVWELQSFAPYKIKVMDNLKNSYILYKLEKI